LNIIFFCHSAAEFIDYHYYYCYSRWQGKFYLIQNIVRFSIIKSESESICWKINYKLKVFVFFLFWCYDRLWKILCRTGKKIRFSYKSFFMMLVSCWYYNAWRMANLKTVLKWIFIDVYCFFCLPCLQIFWNFFCTYEDVMSFQIFHFFQFWNVNYVSRYGWFECRRNVLF
jgi:hypothetical protein